MTGKYDGLVKKYLKKTKRLKSLKVFERCLKKKEKKGSFINHDPE